MDTKVESVQKTYQELQQDNAELKDLILKINLDKTMYEKKVQRRNAEIQKLKETLQEKEEALAKAEQQINLNPQIIEAKKENDAKKIQNEQKYLELLTLEQVILSKNDLVGQANNNTALMIFQALLVKLTQSQEQQQNETIQLEQQIQQQKNTIEALTRQVNEFKSRANNETYKLTKSEKEVAKLLDQIKMDTNYNNKRINMLEDNFNGTIQSLQKQVQAFSNENQVMSYKIVFLSNKILVLEKTIVELNNLSLQQNDFKEQLLDQYNKLLSKYKQLKEGEKKENMKSLEFDKLKSQDFNLIKDNQQHKNQKAPLVTN